MTVATDKDKKFWNKIAQKYARHKIADEEAYRMKLKMTQEYFMQESQVLEFGCGTGSTALIHAPFVQFIEAIDVSEEMIGIAQSKADAQGIKNVNFQQADIANMPKKDGQYDVILGMSILHLLRNRRKVIAETYDRLKPGGVFVSSTSCLGDGMGFMQPLLKIGRWLGQVPYVEFFKQNELVQELTSAGFQIVHQWQPKKNAAVFLVVKKGKA